MKALPRRLRDYWGDKDEILNSQKTPTYAQGIDLPPPLYFGVALEKGSIKDARVQVHSSSRDASFSETLIFCGTNR